MENAGCLVCREAGRVYGFVIRAAVYSWFNEMVRAGILVDVFQHAAGKSAVVHRTGWRYLADRTG